MKYQGGGREALNNRNLFLEFSMLTLRFWVLIGTFPHTLVILPGLPILKGRCSPGLSLVRTIILVTVLMT